MVCENFKKVESEFDENTLLSGEGFRFTAKELDAETSLYYMSARYMDPRTSRWISADPAGARLINPMDEEGKPRSGYSMGEANNWYSYVSNNPLKYTDPTGMEGDDWLESSRELKILEYNKEELLSSLGEYGDPSKSDGHRASSSSSPPQYEPKDTTKMKTARMLSDAFTDDYGIGTSLSSVSGLAGSMKLRTHRRRGSDDVIAFELFVFSETDDLMIGTGNPRFDFVLEDNIGHAESILLANPDLMQDALINSKPSGWQKFWEGFAKLMSPQ